MSSNKAPVEPDERPEKKRRAETKLAADDSDLITLNVRGTKLVVPKGTLAAISLFEPLLNDRWNDESYRRDGDGNLYIHDDPILFEKLINHLENIRRPTPLALEFPPPFFEGAKEQEFRLMVDGYGLTDALYPLTLLQDTSYYHNDHSGTSMHANRVTGKAVSVPFKFETIDFSKEYTIATANNHQRKIRAFEVTVKDPTRIDFLRVGWVSEEKRTFYMWEFPDPDDVDELLCCAHYIEENLDAKRQLNVHRADRRIRFHFDGSTVLRLEREKMRIFVNGLFQHAFLDTPAADLQPRIYVPCSAFTENATTISKIEFDA